MKRRAFFRLVVAVLVCVLLWILWFSINFDAELADRDEGFNGGPQSLGRQFVDKSSLTGKPVDLPDDIDSLVIPEVGAPGRGNASRLKVRLEEATGLTFHDRVFYLNGMPFRIFSGAVHYFRIVPEYWEDRLKKLKACGLNTVETYVAWNLHEPSPGVFNFDGMLDLKKFINLAGSLGLYVILRPGPYICSEFEFGGLPGWLLHDPDMKVRTNYPGYVSAVNKYFSVLLPMMKDLQFTEGGPIIMFQVENEYSAYGADIQHLKLLVYLMKSHGLKELLVVSDHKFKEKFVENRDLDFSKYALLTDNFDSVESNSFSVIRSLNQHFPVMVMEFWSGWFDVWGQDHHSTSALRDVNASLNFILNEGGSFNLYMFIGGTNFGFNAGAINMSSYQPMVTSYDYDAPLTESGDITPKYKLIRNTLLQFYKSMGIKSLPAVPPNIPKADYGRIQVTEVMEWDVFISLIPIGTTDNKVNYMETYKDHNGLYNTVGYIVYSHFIGGNTHWNKLPGVQITGYARDRLTAILNSETFFVLDYLMKTQQEEDKFLHYNWDQKWQRDQYQNMFNYSNDYDALFSRGQWMVPFMLRLKEMGTRLTKRMSTKLSQRLDLMVENLGRVNYSPRNKALLDIQRKGLQGPVFRYIFDIMEDWNIRFINFSPEQCRILSKSSTWMTVKEVERKLQENDEKEKRAPRLFRAYLNITGAPTDTFVKMEGWTKGVVIVNRFNLGRYWNIGPQRTLYLPGPLLRKGENEILIFEEDKHGKEVIFQDHPQLQ